jgi:uncharacterized protein (TIGR00255 family)
MTMTSMTGFARSTGNHGPSTWQWEIKSVNGKALDVRLRLPPGLDHIENEVRSRTAKAVKRGNLQVNLQLNAGRASEIYALNEDVLSRYAEMAERLRDKFHGQPLQPELLLSLKGVVEAIPVMLDEAENAERDAALLASYGEALSALVQARTEEGARLQAVLQAQLDRVSDLTREAAANPSRKVEAIRLRLTEQVARLMETGQNWDEQRLHQEAIILATRADIQEELDRLNSHLAAAAALMRSREPVGRKFDFLTQEFNREANTLCSKANDVSLTAIGLELKTVIDQLREQVQNIE